MNLIKMLVNKMDKPIIPISFLQSGNSLPVSQDVFFKHPTYEDILSLDKEHNGLFSEKIYNSMRDLFLTDPYLYMVFLDDNGLDYEKTSPFQLFVLLYQKHMSLYSDYLIENPNEDISPIIENDIYARAFKFFMNVENVSLINLDGENIFIYDEDKFLFNETNYQYVYEFVKLINGIREDSSRINPEDEIGKMILIEDEREKIKKSKMKADDEKETSDDKLGGMLSSITWSCNGGITPFNRAKLHIYDIVDGINRYGKLLNFENIMHGLYAGTIDKKSIDFEKNHWSL